MIRVLRNYVFWGYERGSFHYDVMVTLILLFVFVGPRIINFHDKPVTTVPLSPSEVLVREAGSNGSQMRFVFQVPVSELDGATGDAAVRAALLNVVQPIAGKVTLQGYKALTDAKGKVVGYDANVLR